MIVSMPLRTAQEHRTTMQIVVNDVLLHKEFGIKAGLPDLSRNCIHPQKAGIMATAAQSKARFSGFRILDGRSVIFLDNKLAKNLKMRLEVDDSRDPREDIRYNAEARAGKKNPNPINFRSESAK